MISCTVIVYLDYVIFHRLQHCLSERNYGCRRRPRYLISVNFQHIVAKMLYPRGSVPDPAEGLRRPRHPAGKRWVTPCRGPHIIAGPMQGLETPRSAAALLAQSRALFLLTVNKLLRPPLAQYRICLPNCSVSHVNPRVSLDAIYHSR